MVIVHVSQKTDIDKGNISKDFKNINKGVKTIIPIKDLEDGLLPRGISKVSILVGGGHPADFKQFLNNADNNTQLSNLMMRV